MPDPNKQTVFKSDKLRIGFSIMLLSVVWAAISLLIDVVQKSDFHWFSASGAVMMCGSILFERL